MALGLNPFVKSLIAVIFTVFLVFLFIGTFIQETNPSSEVLSSKYGINASRDELNSSLSAFQDLGENVKDQLEGSEPSPTDFLFLIFQGAFTIPLTFLSFTFNGIKALSIVLFPTLQGSGLGVLSTIGLGIIFSALVITMVLLIVKAIRTGEAER